MRVAAGHRNKNLEFNTNQNETCYLPINSHLPSEKYLNLSRLETPKVHMCLQIYLFSLVSVKNSPKLKSHSETSVFLW